MPVAAGGVVFSLEDGAIVLDPSRLAPEAVPANVNVANFSANATFKNPVNASFRSFSYGIKFRESDGQYQLVTINSAGLVRYLIGTVGTEGEVDIFSVSTTFAYGDIKMTGSESNSLHLTVIDDRAWLFVNGEYVSEFTVDGVGTSADVEYVAELENETNVSGAITGLSAAEVRSAELESFIVSGSLVKESGEISHTELTGSLINSIVQAEFVSPYEQILGRWSVGFEYIEPGTSAANWFVINNRGEWKHFRRVGETGEVIEIVGGSSANILRDRGDVNTLLLLGRSGIFEVFINGTFITQLTVDMADLPGRVSAIAGFGSADQKPGVPTQFSDYSVWSLGS